MKQKREPISWTAKIGVPLLGVALIAIVGWPGAVAILALMLVILAGILALMLWGRTGIEEPSVDIAKRILAEHVSTFSLIGESDFFPPRAFLNEFLMSGRDPADQDGLWKWKPFSLSSDEYEEIKAWWVSNHAGAAEDSLGTNCWYDWNHEVVDRISD
jgi:hypothetical protein